MQIQILLPRLGLQEAIGEDDQQRWDLSKERRRTKAQEETEKEERGENDEDGYPDPPPSGCPEGRRRSNRSTAKGLVEQNEK